MADGGAGETPGPDVFFFGGGGPGWRPILHLARMTARLFGGRLRLVDFSASTTTNRLRWRLPARGGGSGDAIVFSTRPDEVRSYAGLDELRRYRRRFIWLVESAFTEYLRPNPEMARFDHIAFMTLGDDAFYRRKYGERAMFLSMGADVLDHGGWEGPRDTDVLRVGRQPAAWEDDARTAAALAEVGLSFAGRPAYVDDLEAQNRIMSDAYRGARFTIAHSNLLATHIGTHPSKEYFTARWTDALANGTVVAGAQPKGDPGLEALLWPGATLDFPNAALADNLPLLTEAARAWTPETAFRNHRMALERLDWRWRLAEIAATMGIAAPALDADLRRIRDRMAALDALPQAS